MQLESTPDAQWVAALSGRTPNAASKGIDEARGQRKLFRFIAREHAREGRPAYGEIDAPLELYALVRLRRPRHVVEVGVSSGVSSAYLLAGLDKNARGTLHSVDLPQRPTARSVAACKQYGSWSLPAGRHPGWAVPASLKARWDLRIGDKARVLPLLAEELPFIDLLVYDVPHEDRGTAREFRQLDAKMAARSMVIVDHGPGGSECAALHSWARRRRGSTFHRRETGLYGTRLPAR